MSNLLLRVMRAHLVMLAITAGLLFGPAQTLSYWQGWVFLALFVGSSLSVSLYLARRDPKLLERRLSIGPLAEQHAGQKVAMLCILAGSIGLVLLSSIDHRMGWSSASAPIVLIGDALVALGWLVFLKVFSENSFASGTIELAPDQKVVATGLYAHVRHPMYAGAVVMLIGVPLALGSWWALIISVAMMMTLVWRLLDEEQFLSAHLPGYCDYQAKVPDRLIPKIW